MPFKHFNHATTVHVSIRKSANDTDNLFELTRAVIGSAYVQIGFFAPKVLLYVECTDLVASFYLLIPFLTLSACHHVILLLECGNFVLIRNWCHRVWLTFIKARATCHDDEPIENSCQAKIVRLNWPFGEFFDLHGSKVTRLEVPCHLHRVILDADDRIIELNSSLSNKIEPAVVVSSDFFLLRAIHEENVIGLLTLA